MRTVSAGPIVSETRIPDHAPDLYGQRLLSDYAADLHSIDDAAIDAFHALGYLAVQRVFSDAEVASARAAIDDLIAGAVPAFRGVQRESGRGSEAARPVRKLMHFVDHEARLAALAHHTGLSALMQRLIGDVPELFQDMALLKGPGGREKPWHQDSAYFDLALGTAVIGIWIALDEADLDNGCMHILPGTHRMGPAEHFKVRDWQICDSAVQTQLDVAVPLPPGGCLIWHGMLHHGSPTNHSSKMRRALQFHYRPASSTRVSTEERMQHFGGAVRGATC